MRTINITSQLLFFAGLLLKLFHIHFNAILMLVGLAGVIISLLIGLIKKQEKANLLLALTDFGWLLLLFVSVKFLPIQTIAFVIAFILLVLTATFLTKKGKTKKLLPLLFPISIALFFFVQPTHKRYRILSINWNYEIETDYITWDKYSWFLYQNNEFVKALEASNKARNIAAELNDDEWVQFIGKHFRAIEERNWENFR